MTITGSRMANFRLMAERFAQQAPLLTTQEKREVMANQQQQYIQDIWWLQEQMNNRFDMMRQALRIIKRRKFN